MLEMWSLVETSSQAGILKLSRLDTGMIIMEFLDFLCKYIPLALISLPVFPYLVQSYFLYLYSSMDSLRVTSWEIPFEFVSKSGFISRGR
jgi:hypothetical protein